MNGAAALRAVAVSALLAFLACAGPGLAQDARPDRVVVSYGAATTPAQERTRARMMEMGALELAQRILSPVRLPRALTLTTAACDGQADAWFEGDTITICYEYIAWIAEVARKTGRPAGVSEESAIAGAFLDVVMHESAHAIFDYLDIPILGREEDAADQMAALWLLTLAREQADRLVAGVAAVYLDDAGYRDLRELPKRRLRFQSATPQADAHSTPIQRLYNLLCLAYGSDPERFAGYARSGALPADRAEGCGEEFRQVAKAYARLIQPHVDVETALRVYGAGRQPGAR
jgi:hypothetical protein